MIWLYTLLTQSTVAMANESTNPTTVSNTPGVDSVYWKGRFHIEGFSFKGAVPGEVTFGPDDQLYFQLLRPSGLPIISLTVLETEVCVLFDLDGIQYRGSHADFNALSKNAMPATSIHAIFRPTKEVQLDGWDWYSTPRIPIRALDIDNADGNFLNAAYKGWRRKDFERGPGRLYIHLGPNDWTLKSNIQRRSTRPWNASCEVDETIEVRPISAMLEALPQ